LDNKEEFARQLSKSNCVSQHRHLLDALEKARLHIEANSRYDRYTGEYLDIEVRDLLDEINAAIAAAKGEV